MPPSRAEDRLDKLIHAATRAFAEGGYRRTQMADVAAAAGTSAGNAYNYVEGKDVLFHLCLVWTSPADEPEREVLRTAPLPIRRRDIGDSKAVVDRGMRAIGARSPLSDALKRDGPDGDIVDELAAIIGAAYDRTAQSAAFQALVERSAADQPELFEAFFVAMRRPFLRSLTTYLERRIASGHLRPVPDAATAARLVNETQAWFARHRRGDLDTADVAVDVARATVIDVLVHGLVQGAPSPKRPRR